MVPAQVASPALLARSTESRLSAPLGCRVQGAAVSEVDWIGKATAQQGGPTEDGGRSSRRPALR